MRPERYISPRWQGAIFATAVLLLSANNAVETDFQTITPAEGQFGMGIGFGNVDKTRKVIDESFALTPGQIAGSVNINEALTIGPWSLRFRMANKYGEGIIEGVDLPPLRIR